VIVPEKLIVLLVLCAVGEVKGEGEVFEGFFAQLPEVVGHRMEECLLIAYNVVVHQVVVYPLLTDLPTFDGPTELEELGTR
jgi:hypothetical protein